MTDAVTVIETEMPRPGVRRAWVDACAVAGIFPLIGLVLWCDAAGAGAGWGRPVALVLTALCLGWLLPRLAPARRRAVWLFVPFSAAGEALFSLGFGWYDYRGGWVPLYVPLGHAILLAGASLFVGHPGVRRHPRAWALAGALFCAAGFGWTLARGDRLSLVLLPLWGIMLWRRRRDPGFLMYLWLAVPVLWIELIGTHLADWRWAPTAWGVASANPPFGAFVCYVGGDLLVLKLERILYMRSITQISGENENGKILGKNY